MSKKKSEECTDPPDDPKRPTPSGTLSYSAARSVEPDLAGLAKFEPAKCSLAQIATLFQFVHACLMGVHVARDSEYPEFEPENWDKVHNRLRIAIQYALRCVEGLGTRLQSTQLVPDAFAIEKAAREAMAQLVQLDMLVAGPEIGESRERIPVPPEMEAAANRLYVLGEHFRHVPPEKDIRRNDADSGDGKITSRLDGERAERVVRVRTQVVALKKEWITAEDLEGIDISAKTVYAASHNWAQGDVQGAGTRHRRYLKARLIRYLEERWTPQGS